MNNIKICPYCKQEPVVFECKSTNLNIKKIYYYVSCDNYNCSNMPMGRYFPVKEDAIKYWNNMFMNVDVENE